MDSVKRLLTIVSQIIGVAIIWTFCLSICASLLLVGLHEGLLWFFFPNWV